MGTNELIKKMDKSFTSVLI